MINQPDEFLIYCYQALMFLIVLFALFGGLGWIADKLEELTENRGRRATDRGA